MIYADNKISLKAKGLYFIIKTMIENNEIPSKQNIYTMSANGHNTVDSAWKELVSNEYLEVSKKNVHGKFIYSYALLK